MAKRIPKSRMISFRISEEEFELLKALYPQHGARNLSDFARAAMLRHLEQPRTEAPDVAASADLFARLDLMQQDLVRLTEMVARLEQPPAEVEPVTKVFRATAAA